MTPPLHDPVELLTRWLETWKTAYVEIDIFGTDDPRTIVGAIAGFCEGKLGSPPVGYRFYQSSIGSTHGVRLRDGRDVVIKARPPASVNPDLRHDPQSLDTVCRAMRWLHARGYPCPDVILGPTPLVNGTATVETLLARGERGNGFEATCRRVIAHGLAHLIGALRDFPDDASHLMRELPAGALYPQPHGRIFDFDATAGGTGWIDDFARRARRLLPPRGTRRVLGHLDWRVEHLRFEGGRIVATYDWDSLALQPETELVGTSAFGFTADWSRDDVRRIPSGDDIHAFVADYEHARGRPFSPQERGWVFASCVASIAYGARCGHALEPRTHDWPPDSFPALLRTSGDALLAEAGPS